MLHSSIKQPTICPSSFVPPHHPHPPPPPPQPVIVETLLRGSSDNSTRTSRTDQSDLKPKPSLSPSSSLHPLSHETTPTQIQSYEDVKRATGDFDNVLFTEGGHKLGQGGFGVVYQGQINLGEGNREVAVKVFVDDVSLMEKVQFNIFCYNRQILKCYYNSRLSYTPSQST